MSALPVTHQVAIPAGRGMKNAGFAAVVGAIRDAERCDRCHKTRAVLNVAAHHQVFRGERVSAETHCTCVDGPAAGLVEIELQQALHSCARGTFPTARVQRVYRVYDESAVGEIRAAIVMHGGRVELYRFVIEERAVDGADVETMALELLDVAEPAQVVLPDFVRMVFDESPRFATQPDAIRAVEAALAGHAGRALTQSEQLAAGMEVALEWNRRAQAGAL